MTSKQFKAKHLNQPIGPKLQKIIDRGSDHCFTAKEEETFSLLTTFIFDESNSEYERGYAVFYYDALMGCEEETIDLWLAKGVAHIIKSFIDGVKECM